LFDAEPAKRNYLRTALPDDLRDLVGCCGTDADTLTQADQTASAGACCPV
jgi:hypothetical protein